MMAVSNGKYGTTCKWYSSANSASTATNWYYPQGTSGGGVFIESEPHYIAIIPEALPAEKRTLKLPDGSKLVMDDNGNYCIEDKDAKVTYKANRLREFSPYLNASDMIARFVEYVGTLGVRQREVLNLPIELFINWLIIEAAKRDGDEVPAEVKRLECQEEIRLLQDSRCLSASYIDAAFSRDDFVEALCA